MNIVKKNITYVYQKNDGSDDKSKNLLVIVKNIVKQLKKSLYSSFTSRQQVCNRFQKESRIIYLVFAKQCSKIDCSKIDNSRELPLNFLKKKTDKSISAITFSCDDIATLIKNLNPNKAHGHDIIAIRMSKLCGKYL